MAKGNKMNYKKLIGWKHSIVYTILIYSICGRFKNNCALYNKPTSLKKEKDLDSTSDVRERRMYWFSLIKKRFWHCFFYKCLVTTVYEFHTYWVKAWKLDVNQWTFVLWRDAVWARQELSTQGRKFWVWVLFCHWLTLLV